MPSETTDARCVIYSSRETKESKQAAAEYYQEKLKKAVAEFVEHQPKESHGHHNTTI